MWDPVSPCLPAQGRPGRLGPSRQTGNMLDGEGQTETQERAARSLSSKCNRAEYGARSTSLYHGHAEQVKRRDDRWVFINKTSAPTKGHHAHSDLSEQ